LRALARFCVYVVHIYKSNSRFKTFISNFATATARAELKVTKKKEQAMKLLLRKNGFSEQTADEIWKWYTCPVKK